MSFCRLPMLHARLKCRHRVCQNARVSQMQHQSDDWVVETVRAGSALSQETLRRQRVLSVARMMEFYGPGQVPPVRGFPLCPADKVRASPDLPFAKPL